MDVPQHRPNKFVYYVGITFVFIVSIGIIILAAVASGGLL